LAVSSPGSDAVSANAEAGGRVCVGGTFPLSLTAPSTSGSLVKDLDTSWKCTYGKAFDVDEQPPRRAIVICFVYN